MHDDTTLLGLIAVPQIDHEDQPMKVNKANELEGIWDYRRYVLRSYSVARLVVYLELDNRRRG